MQNAFAESSIGRLRDELLNETLFRSLPHAGVVLDASFRSRMPATEWLDPHTRLVLQSCEPQAHTPTQSARALVR